ncbi:MAG: hypothetical protein K6T37_10625, partial [Acidothermus cellulolyticus]|nr:hypothetical protein [Acidothermus cellulolyticus]
MSGGLDEADGDGLADGDSVADGDADGLRLADGEGPAPLLRCTVMVLPTYTVEPAGGSVPATVL